MVEEGLREDLEEGEAGVSLIQMFVSEVHGRCQKMRLSPSGFWLKLKILCRDEGLGLVIFCCEALSTWIQIWSS